jgi:hypothetical protein
MFTAMILFPVLAEAQAHTETSFPPLLTPLEPPMALPASGTQGGYFSNLRPLGADFGRVLADNGIYLAARDLSVGFDNLGGGVKRGSSYEGYATLGLSYAGIWVMR